MVGVLHEDLPLPAPVSSWAARGYRLLLPLHDLHGEIVAVQARDVTGFAPSKTRTCGRGGVLFANALSLQLLRGKDVAGPVIVAEGWTDLLAITIHAAGPVLGIPGTSTAVSAMGPWCRGRSVVLAFDADSHGVEATTKAAHEARAHEASAVQRVAWPSGAVDACDALSALGGDDFAAFLQEVTSW